MCRQGTGKSLFLDEFGKLFGQSYIPISQIDQITGRFNMHLASARFIVCEEAVWNGNKKAEGVLKDLITRPTMQIEPKGHNIFTVANYAHLAFTTNHGWVVPAGEGERRFCVQDVGDGNPTKSLR